MTGRRSGIWLWLLAWLAGGISAWAFDHPRGRISASIGGSAAYSANEEIRREGSQEVIFDDVVVELEATEDRDDYTDTDLSFFLSGGYTIIDRLELGLLSSLFETTYQSTDREDYSLQDVQLYAKYYFDNTTRATPYLKVQGGRSWLTSGDYEERNQVIGAVGGLECYGFGPIALFVELNSQYTDLNGDREGYEWRNQIYLGVSFYWTVKPPPTLPVDVTPETADGLESVTAGAEAPRDDVPTLPPQAQRWVDEANRTWDGALDAIDRRTDGAAEAP